MALRLEVQELRQQLAALQAARHSIEAQSGSAADAAAEARRQLEAALDEARLERISAETELHRLKASWVPPETLQAETAKLEAAKRDLKVSCRRLPTPNNAPHHSPAAPPLDAHATPLHPWAHSSSTPPSAAHQLSTTEHVMAPGHWHIASQPGGLATAPSCVRKCCARPSTRSIDGH